MECYFIPEEDESKSCDGWEEIPPTSQFLTLELCLLLEVLLLNPDPPT